MYRVSMKSHCGTPFFLIVLLSYQKSPSNASPQSSNIKMESFFLRTFWDKCIPMKINSGIKPWKGSTSLLKKKKRCLLKL